LAGSIKTYRINWVLIIQLLNLRNRDICT
jgi:hypothetical protein